MATPDRLKKIKALKKTPPAATAKKRSEMIQDLPVGKIKPLQKKVRAVYLKAGLGIQLVNKAPHVSALLKEGKKKEAAKLIRSIPYMKKYLAWINKGSKRKLSDSDVIQYYKITLWEVELALKKHVKVPSVTSSGLEHKIKLNDGTYLIFGISTGDVGLGSSPGISKKVKKTKTSK
ncbi:hypothetical protein ACFL10_00450 [Patescibacteria group bacterium]